MQNKSLGFFDRRFQEGLLAHVLRHPPLLRQFAAGHLSQDDFDIPIHRAILTAAQQILEIQKKGSTEIITKDTLLPHLKLMRDAELILPMEIGILSETIARLYQVQLSPDYYMPALERFILFQRGKKELKSADPNDIEGLANSLQQIVRSSRTSGRVTGNPLRDLSIGEKEDTIPTGILALDSRMQGGIGRRRAGLICGIQGLGKSAFAMNIAVNAALLGYKTRLISTELPQDEFQKRICS